MWRWWLWKFLNWHKSQALRGKFAVFPFCSLYKTNRFQVVVRLFSNRSQKTSKCGKNISDTLACGSCATFLFLPHFGVICDLLLKRRTATWNLFVKWSPHGTFESEDSWWELYIVLAYPELVVIRLKFILSTCSLRKPWQNLIAGI